MNEKKSKAKLEPLLSSFHLKRPSQEVMSDFLEGVHRKIESAGLPRAIGFPKLAFAGSIVLAAGLAVYFSLAQLHKPAPAAALARAAVLSAEEEQAILDAFGEDAAEAVIDFIDFNELDKEMTALDEMEFNF